MKIKCGDANPKGNIYLTAKGGCRKELEIEDAYRCTGCGVWFHKDCILEHFKLEEKDDWGRQEERNKINGLIDKVQKQCFEADATIDGITALHALKEEINEPENKK